MIIVQRALWSADLASKGQNVFDNLADTWVTLAWLNTPEDDEVLSGSADVFRPVVLSAILNERLVALSFFSLPLISLPDVLRPS